MDTREKGREKEMIGVENQALIRNTEDAIRSDRQYDKLHNLTKGQIRYFILFCS